MFAYLTCFLHLQEEPAAVTSSGSNSNNAGASNVNKAIQQLAHRYCVDSKSTFDELSKIIQVGAGPVSFLKSVQYSYDEFSHGPGQTVLI